MATSSTAPADPLEFRYRFGGVRLVSSVALDQLRPDHAAAPPPRAAFALEIARGAPPRPDRIVHRWAGRYGLTLARLGDDWLFASALDGAFRIDFAQARIRGTVADCAGAAWRDVFVRRVLPRVAILAGATAFHAAALARDGGAVLLLGRSGAGKSTLCAALGTAGWDVLSEDVALLWDADAPLLAPATTGVCLWEDSRRGLALPAARCAPMPGYDGKSRFASGNDRAIAPVPLRAVLVLARGAAPGVALHRLGGAEAMLHAAQQRFRFNPADDRHASLDTFQRLRAIVAAVPCHRLAYPADYAALGAVERVLRQLVSSHPRGVIEPQVHRHHEP